MEQVRALNYSAHAIEDLKKLAQANRYDAPQSARAIQKVISMLRNSIKFILPNCCELIDPEDFKQAHLDVLRLPYPCVAFEAPWKKEGEHLRTGEFEETLSTKRIALCWEADPVCEAIPGINHWLQFYPDGGVFTLPIYYSDAHKQWLVASGGLFVPHENVVKKITMDQKLPASVIAKETKLSNGEAKMNNKEFLAEPFVVLPEFHEQIAFAFSSKAKATANIILNAHDEVSMMIQACSVLNCANIMTTDLKADAVANRTRTSSGKQQFFSYKVLQLNGEPQSSSNANGKPNGHASPRMHLRRGHLRRLENKTVWVRHTMVNAGSKLGVVVKDYRINP